MRRRTLLQGLAGLLVAPLLPACTRKSAHTSTSPIAATAAANPEVNTANRVGGDPVTPLEQSDESWKSLLTPAAFTVLFQDGTERAFSSPLNEEKRPGSYICAACYLPLFDSKRKFDSGTGWPSFTQSIAGHTDTRRDFKLVLPRTEYHCARCGGHQGHIFNDGPAPLGDRWCNNGVALNFVPEGDPLPSLRS